MPALSGPGGGAPAAPFFGAPGGDDPQAYVPGPGYCSWAVAHREGGCGTGGDYCWLVGHGTAFGDGTIEILRRPFGGSYSVMGSNLIMSSRCPAGTIWPSEWGDTQGPVVAYEQAVVALVVLGMVLRSLGRF